ncbi:hypothetical protein GCM10027452_36360 [Micromonospora halotolerans]
MTRLPSASELAVWLPEPRAAILAWERFHGNASMRSVRTAGIEHPGGARKWRRKPEAGTPVESERQGTAARRRRGTGRGDTGGPCQPGEPQKRRSTRNAPTAYKLLNTNLLPYKS